MNSKTNKSGMDEFVRHIEAIKGYFLDDKRLLGFVAFRPRNTDLIVIDEKVLFLLQRTKINPFSHESISEVISSLGIDHGLSNGDAGLVSKIAFEIPEEALGFASKYCAAHAPDHYPLYNDHSIRVLQAIYGTSYRLTDYEIFYREMQRVRTAFKMDVLNFFEVSKLFWIFQNQLLATFHSKNHSDEQNNIHRHSGLHAPFKLSDLGSKNL